ncbi:MAG TPA: nucleotidyltransferase domain-containing protein [Syntrophorhabdaceae bacterium]|nr:nucleotidyltransferase domain-containing protein [Syntrophorhabdaceae bacterium]
MNDVTQIIKTIDQVLEPVEPIEYAFLFGSILRQLLPQSDIDILIGDQITFDQRLLLTATLSRNLHRNVDLVSVSEASSELVLKALSRGIPVFIRNRETLKRDYMTAFRDNDNNSGLRQIKFSRIRKQYAHG